MNSQTTIRVLLSFVAILIPDLLSPIFPDWEHTEAERTSQAGWSAKSAVNSMAVAGPSERVVQNSHSDSPSKSGSSWQGVWQYVWANSAIPVILLCSLFFSIVGLIYQNQRIRKRHGELVALLEKTQGMLNSPKSLHTLPCLDTVDILNRVTHEIRNPLSVILSSCQVLQNQNESQINRDTLVDTIENRVRQIAVSVEGFLEYACLNQGVVEPCIEPFCLVEEIEQVSALVAYQIAQPAFKTKIHSSEMLPQWIKVDGSKLRQVLLYMIREASLGDFKSVGVTIRDHQEENGPLMLSIEAYGQNPNPRYSDSVKSATTGESVQGNTQPLCPDFPTVQRMTECMGGVISRTHHSKLNSIELSIPYEASSNPMNDPHIKLNPNSLGSNKTSPTNASDSISDSNPEVRENSISILIVDDETALLIAVQSLLGQQGFNVLTSSNSQEALTCIQNQSVDLVITDLTMPGGDGYELLRQLRRLPEHAQLPVVATTGNVTPDLRKQVKNAGFNHLLTKPYWIEDLLTAIQVAMENQQTNSQ